MYEIMDAIYNDGEEERNSSLFWEVSQLMKSQGCQIGFANDLHSEIVV